MLLSSACPSVGCSDWTQAEMELSRRFLTTIIRILPPYSASPLMQRQYEHITAITAADNAHRLPQGVVWVFTPPCTALALHINFRDDPAGFRSDCKYSLGLTVTEKHSDNSPVSRSSCYLTPIWRPGAPQKILKQQQKKIGTVQFPKKI